MLTASSPNICAQCGAPRTQSSERCSYCGAAAPRPAVPPDVLAAAVRDVLARDADGDGVPDILERPRPPVTPFGARPPAPTPTSGANVAIVAVGAATAIAMCAGVLVFVAMRTPPPPPRPSKPTSPPSVASVASEPPTLSPSALPSAPSAPNGPSETAKPKPAIKMTNEQYGKSRVAAVQPKILACVEQDLVRNPAVPKAYSVTVLVEKDGSPLNSATKFSPKPTEGFRSCATTEIFYAFDRNPPNPGAFTFTTSIAFPNAKPAAKAESGRGWD